MGRISLDLWTRIEKDLPISGDASGPEVLAAVVDHMQQVNESKVRQFVKELEGQSLKKDTG